MYISREEARKMLSVSISTLSRMVKEYGFKTKKVGKQNLIFRGDIESFLNDYELVDEVEVVAPAPVKVSDFMEYQPPRKVYQQGGSQYENGRATDRDFDALMLAQSPREVLAEIDLPNNIICDDLYRKSSSANDLVNMFTQPEPVAQITTPIAIQPFTANENALISKLVARGDLATLNNFFEARSKR